MTNPLTCTKAAADEALYERMILSGMERWETDVAAKQGEFEVFWDESGAVWKHNGEAVLVWDEGAKMFTNVGEMSVTLRNFL